jgi:hypothetical protein
LAAVRRVIVLGVRRSGTSLTAGLVGKLGYFIENDSRPPDEHNPEGYWESKRVQDLNASLLNHLEGSGNRPPKAPVGWEDRPEFSKEKGRAKSIVEDYEKHDSWCIKDDRFSVTLPLWKRVLPPEVSYIVCLRNPLAVVRSIQDMTADNVDRALAFRAWSAYTRHAILNTQGERRLIVLYEDFHGAPQFHVKRLCDFLRVEPKPELESQFKSELHHQQPTLHNFLDEKEASMETKLLYISILAAMSGAITLDEVGRSLDRSF